MTIELSIKTLAELGARQPDAPAVEVFDTFGQTWRVKAAPCGSGCYCAMSAELVYA